MSERVLTTTGDDDFGFPHINHLWYEVTLPDEFHIVVDVL